MINLEPIPTEIQKRLFEKMRALGRQGPSTPNSSVSTEALTHDKMATRSTFVRMTSGQVNPVTLMGGSLKQDGGIRGGYDEIYGSREYKQSFSTLEEYEEYDFDNFFDENKDLESTTVNQNGSRPMPGVKSINVEFKGGLRAFRDATVNWTCWDWKELMELTPHFLAHGKTVMLQWGWVYDENSIKNIPNFITTDTSGGGSGISFIDESAYTDYKNVVIDGKGDFDLMVGIVKNFEYTTREDGGFDCTTTLTNIGVNIMDNPEPNQDSLPKYLKTNLKFNEANDEIIGKLQNALRDEDDNKDLNDVEKTKLVGLSSNVSLKLFIKNMDRYIENLIQSDPTAQDLNADVGSSGRKNVGSFVWIPQKVIAYVPFYRIEEINTNVTKGVKTEGLLETIVRQAGGDTNLFKRQDRLGTSETQARYKNIEYWVTWGWFEDNVLSKFATQISSKTNKIVNTFRSVERILDTNGKESQRYESTRISNHEFLETVDPHNYILPGQFEPQTKQKFEDPEDKGRSPITLEGDTQDIVRLAGIINNSQNFQRFACSNEFITVEYIDESIVADVVQQSLGISKISSLPQAAREKYEGVVNEQKRKLGELGIEFAKKKGYTSTKEIAKPDRFGYLRNMLISLSTIKEAFGVSAPGEDFTIESISISEAMENLFNILNRPLKFWDFGMTSDTVDVNNVKIIDEQSTKFDFSQTVSSQRTRVDGDGNTFTERGGSSGVFFFPVWKSDSMVKRQNVTAKVPNAMALTAMYGSNLDQFTESSNVGGKHDDTGVVLAGGLNNSDDDSRLGGITSALFSGNDSDRSWQNIGSKNYFDSSPLSKSGDDILTFIKSNAKALFSTFTSKAETLKIDLETATQQKNRVQIDKEFAESFDASLPPPLITSNTNAGDVFLLLSAIRAGVPTTTTSDKYLTAIARQLGFEGEFADNGKWFGNPSTAKKFLNFFNSKYTGNPESGQKFKMKPEFVDTVRFLTSGQRGEFKDGNSSVLIPLDVELDVDGIGGIYPGNSFHSTYLPAKYKNRTVFQAFDVTHAVDSSGWTTTISGRMRSTLNQVFTKIKTFDELNNDIFENYIAKITGKYRSERKIKNLEDAKKNLEADGVGQGGGGRPIDKAIPGITPSRRIP